MDSLRGYQESLSLQRGQLTKLSHCSEHCPLSLTDTILRAATTVSKGQSRAGSLVPTHGRRESGGSLASCQSVILAIPSDAFS